MKLGPALVMTPDLEAALGFYRDMLGLTLAERFENQLVFDLGGQVLHVFGCARPAPEAEHGADGASVISFEVEAIEAAMADLAAKGVEFLHAQPAWNAEAGLAYAAFRAPGGIVHELVERPAKRRP
ncbi:VOC family protein [Phenylobacterium sp.]|uniref:VOC family protein n=1 Tax=Phenylobacterium sp. TaxID=1871053 RepID=UPI0028982A72|nr:VOC family protein [Phenylobacterium sp.]